jgi:thiosulfate sulfurtransferase
MPSSVSSKTLRELLGGASPPVVIDVRKQAAFLQSGLAIRHALRRLPEETDVWSPEFGGSAVIVYCVHGHEVSQGVCALLCKNGIEASYLEGGFENWQASGGPVQPAGETR